MKCIRFQTVNVELKKIITGGYEFLHPLCFEFYAEEVLLKQHGGGLLSKWRARFSYN